MLEFREENKILMQDLNFITNPNLRKFMHREQLRVMEKRALQQGQRSQNTSRYFGQFFNNLEGSGNYLPDY